MAENKKAPLYINGRYVVEKQLPAKLQKGEAPYAQTEKQIKVTLIKSTNGCLKDQQATVTRCFTLKIIPRVASLSGKTLNVRIFVRPNAATVAC